MTNLFCAFYREKLLIENAEDFLTLVKLADYYCALKVVSYAIDTTLLKNVYFRGVLDSFNGIKNRILDDAPQIIEAAAKLRHAILFKELVIYCANPWSEPKFKQADMPEKYRKVAEGVYDRLSAQVTKANSSIAYIRSIFEKGSDQQMRSYMEDIEAEMKYDARVRDIMRRSRDAYMPEYFRKL